MVARASEVATKVAGGALPLVPGAVEVAKAQVEVAAASVPTPVPLVILPKVAMTVARRATGTLLAAEEATPFNGPLLKVVVTAAPTAAVPPVAVPAGVVIPAVVQAIELATPGAACPPGLAAMGGAKAP